MLRLAVTFSLLCIQQSFQNIQVKVNNNTVILVSGSISPRVLPQLPKYQLAEKLELSITNQTITSLNEGVVADFRGKLHIDFNFNHINTIRSSAFVNLWGLQQVQLHNNDIHTIEPAAFINLPSLTSIRLSNNQIVSLGDGTFKNLPQLKSLDLEHNRLTAFNQMWLINTPTLTDLKLSNNMIRTIPSAAFDSLPALRNLDLSSNQIASIDKDAFYGLGHLRAVLLGDNKLKTLRVHFYSTFLDTLVITMNNLTYVPDVVLKNIENSIKTFGVYGNPLQCACFDKVVQWCNDHNIEDPFSGRPFSEVNPVCVTPLDGQTECWENLDEVVAQDLRKVFYENYRAI